MCVVCAAAITSCAFIIYRIKKNNKVHPAPTPVTITEEQEMIEQV
jgi:hypothetical protein